MQQGLVWKPWTNPGVEHLNLDIASDGVNASSHLMQSIRGNSIVATIPSSTTNDGASAACG
jgi:hypothetical protein